jgi:hypothetical protein
LQAALIFAIAPLAVLSGQTHQRGTGEQRQDFTPAVALFA